MIPIYDINTVGFEYWDVVAGGLVFSVLGLAFKKMPRFFFSAAGSNFFPWLPAIFFWGGIFWAVVVIGLTYSDASKKRSLYESGQYFVVEGQLAAVLPVRRGVRDYNSIKVGAEEFILPRSLRSNEVELGRLIGKTATLFVIGNEIIYIALDIESVSALRAFNEAPDSADSGKGEVFAGYYLQVFQAFIVVSFAFRIREKRKKSPYENASESNSPSIQTFAILGAGIIPCALSVFPLLTQILENANLIRDPARFVLFVANFLALGALVMTGGGLELFRTASYNMTRPFFFGAFVWTIFLGFSSLG